MSAPGGSLLALRAFLGVTFTFAGLQKLSNPTFWRTGAPGSFQQQLLGSIATSPLHHLLAPATHVPTLVALVISFGELAVGLGTLLGLYGRTAALGGMALSLTFFLTVSFGTSPYYYGSDIVFLFAWTPLAVAEPGEWSLDGWFARLRREAGERQHSAPGTEERRDAAALERRTFLLQATWTVVAGIFTLGLGAVVAGVGRLINQGQAAVADAGVPTLRPGPASPAPGGPGGTVPAGTRIGPADDVPVAGAASFTDPARRIPAYVVQPAAGRFVAFSAICTHAGCTVSFDEVSDEFVCPCHGSVFNSVTGAVIQGPATRPLPSIPVSEVDGQLYVDE